MAVVAVGGIAFLIAWAGAEVQKDLIIIRDRSKQDDFKRHVSQCPEVQEWSYTGPCVDNGFRAEIRVTLKPGHSLPSMAS